MPLAHKMCKYSLGNRHWPQWTSPNSFQSGRDALDEPFNTGDVGVVGGVTEDNVTSLGVEGDMETGVEGVEVETMGAERADIIFECEGRWLFVGEEGIISSVLALLLLTPFFFGSACFCFFLLYSIISLST